MGLYDYVNFEMPCPNCGALLDSFQTKDGLNALEKIEPNDVHEFYDLCKECGAFITFSRQRYPPVPKPATREDVEKMGFRMTIEPPAGEL